MPDGAIKILAQPFEIAGFTLRPPFHQNPPLPRRPTASALQPFDLRPESARSRPVHTSVALMRGFVHVDAPPTLGISQTSVMCRQTTPARAQSALPGEPGCVPPPSGGPRQQLS